MPIKKYRPHTPSRRFLSTITFEGIAKKRPEKSLTEFIGKSGGRNNAGRITSNHRGGGHKRLYRRIDFKRNKDGMKANVIAIEYDPNRTANIALLEYEDGEKRYIIAPQGLAAGSVVESGSDVEVATGNCLPLRNIPLGMFVHNVEMKPLKGGQIARGAGSGCQLMAKEENFAFLNMPSGELRKVHIDCRATMGVVGNTDIMNVVEGKAGRTRWRGQRPRVRGICRNPVDHPMGGGEGRSKGGNHPQSVTGVYSKGFKTRKPQASDKLIVRRRKKGKR